MTDQLIAEQQLLARIAMSHDFEDADGVAACFTEDGVMQTWMRDTPDEVTEIRGREAIAEHSRNAMARKPCPRRHFLGTSVCISREGPNGITHVKTYVQVWQLPSGDAAQLVTTGTYHDQITSGSDPRIAVRGIELDSSPFPG